MSSQSYYPEAEALSGQIAKRHSRGKFWRGSFLTALVVAILVLVALVYNVANQAFGLVAVENAISPSSLVESVGADPATTELADLDKDLLVGILEENISLGLGRRLERDQRFYEDRLVFDNPQAWDVACSAAEPAAGCSLPARDASNVLELVVERVVESQVIETWSLRDSLLNGDAIRAEVALNNPNAEVEFRSWLTADFLMRPQSSRPEFAGVRTAIFGSLWVVLVTLLFSFPVGVGAAIYLEEYASKQNLINRIIQTNINNLAGVPSIIYGMLGLAIFVRVLGAVSSGYLFDYGSIEARQNSLVNTFESNFGIVVVLDDNGNVNRVNPTADAAFDLTTRQAQLLIDEFASLSWRNFDINETDASVIVAKSLGIPVAVESDANGVDYLIPRDDSLISAEDFSLLSREMANVAKAIDNGRTVISAGLTLGLLILPIIIINAQEAIRAVPLSMRQGSMGLGATQWQTIWHHVLPQALPGILTGTILAMSRAIGETAPLVVVGASTFIAFDPDGPFSKFTVMPIQIYQWTARPQAEFRNIAAAAIIVLLVLLLSLNATAVLLRNRYAKEQ